MAKNREVPQTLAFYDKVGKMKKFVNWFKKDPLFATLILSIIAVAIFFLTANYNSRVSIIADSSRDVQVARYAADHGKIPQIGQFSSAGPFFYGPWYYWFLEITSFLPLGPLTHWYVMTLIYLGFVILIFFLGYELGGKVTGAFASLFAAISPAQIASSTSVWNPAIIPLLSLLSLIFLVRFAKYRRLLDLWLLGLIVGLAVTIHFQSFLILPILPTALFLALFIKPKLHPLKAAVVLFFGFLIPFLPLIYFDARFHWHNFTSLFVYLTVDQFRIWIPNRWLTYLFDYWPQTWANIIGGQRAIGFLLIGLLGILTLAKLKEFKKQSIFYLVAVTFILEVIAYRYYRGERFFYYSFFAHPAILVLSATCIQKIWQAKKIVGLAITALVIATTIPQSFKNLKEPGVSFREINSLKQEIYLSFPNQKVDIYGCRENTTSISHPLALFMYLEGRNETSGVKIGVCEIGNDLTWQVISQDATKTEKGLWFNKSTEEVYRHTVEWWIKDPPPTGGSLWQFVKKSLSPRCYPHC